MLFAFPTILLILSRLYLTSYGIKITTDVGEFIGHEFVSSFTPGKKSVQFLGIPYAEPPTGDRRFRIPVVKKPLTETFNASTYGPSCIQNDLIGTGAVFSEDCLFLNIFAPVEALNGSGVVVMVWIHGGGFIAGNSDFADPRHFASFGNVIVVSMNYRLDVFGFLSTGDGEAAGNYGLWDQQLAIQWVKLHIKRFGGDKDRITIFGESAGGASVTYQMMYRGNKGLFQRAIAQSGSLFSRWAYKKPSEETFKEYVRMLDCSSTKSKEVVTCLKTKTAKELLEATNKIKYTLDNLLFAPVKDGAFIDYEPATIYDVNTADSFDRLKGIDYLVGICDYDGTPMRSFLPPFTYMNGTSKAHLEEVVIPQISGQLSKDTLIQSFVKHILSYKYKNYEDESPIKRKDELLNLLTDNYFTIPMIKSLWKHKTNNDSKSFMYLFRHRPFFSLYPMNGAGHTDDLIYVFGFSKFAEMISRRSFSNLSAIPDSELEFAKVTMKYWSNFAKTGNPNMPEPIPSQWPEYTMKEQKYLDFGATAADIKPKDYLYAERVALWMDLIPSITKTQGEECSVSGSPGLVKADILFVVSTITLAILGATD